MPVGVGLHRRAHGPERAFWDMRVRLAEAGLRSNEITDAAERTLGSARCRDETTAYGMRASAVKQEPPEQTVRVVLLIGTGRSAGDTGPSRRRRASGRPYGRGPG